MWGVELLGLGVGLGVWLGVGCRAVSTGCMAGRRV